LLPATVRTIRAFKQALASGQFSTPLQQLIEFLDEIADFRVLSQAPNYVCAGHALSHMTANV
jgi:hypothetical protein